MPRFRKLRTTRLPTKPVPPSTSTFGVIFVVDSLSSTALAGWDAPTNDGAVVVVAATIGATTEKAASRKKVLREESMDEEEEEGDRGIGAGDQPRTQGKFAVAITARNSSNTTVVVFIVVIVVDENLRTRGSDLAKKLSNFL